MASLKIIGILALPALVAIIIYQNTAVMQLSLLFWSVSMSASLMVPAVFFTGFVTGLSLLLLSSRKKAQKVKAENK